MGFMDDAKKKLTDAVDKHGDKINQGLDKAAAAVDKKTGGKHSDKISQGVAKAKQGLDNLDSRHDDLGRTGGTAGSTPTAATGSGQDTPGTGPGPSRGTQHPAGPSSPSTPTEKKQPKAPTGPMGDGTPGGTPGVDR